MHCTSCEKIICKALSKHKAVISCKADYPTETVSVTYNAHKISKQELFEIVDKKGYECSEMTDARSTQRSSTLKNLLGWVSFIIGVFVLITFFGFISDTLVSPDITENISYGLLFLLGLFTGFHCVGMCGGFVVSYTTKLAQEGKMSHVAHIEYGVAKTLSYTVIGAAFGLVGAVFTFTPFLRGIAALLAGAFLIIFGINMLNVFPALRKVRIQLPNALNRFVITTSHDKKRGPIVIGLLNGLMIACGPLQAIYILAAGTGNPIDGGLMLLAFGLGTLPVMLSFGYLTSYMSKSFTRTILKASGVIVVVLGLLMVNTGLTLAGINTPFSDFAVKKTPSSQSGNSLGTSSGTTGDSRIEQGIAILSSDGTYQEIYMDVTRYGWEPAQFTLLEGVPVKWHINGKEITGCNKAIIVPEYKLEFDIVRGEQVIEFVPTQSKTVPWSCWMGMIRGTFIVESDKSKFE